MKTILISILLLSIVSCKEGSQNYTDDFHSEIVISDSLMPIIDSLIKYEIVDDAYVGYSGIKSNTYEYFEKLISTSTETELIDLTDHPSPTIRAYSFWALVLEKNPNIKGIMLNHVKDTAEVLFCSGCNIEFMPLNELLLTIINPQCINTNCAILPEEDIEEIKSKMK